MKITLDLNDQLLAEAKALAARQRTSLTRLIEEGCRCGFARTPAPGSGVRFVCPCSGAAGVWWLA